MAKGGKKEHLARVLDSHIHNIEETLQVIPFILLLISVSFDFLIISFMVCRCWNVLRFLRRWIGRKSLKLGMKSPNKQQLV